MIVLLILQAALYLFAGINHFRQPRFYLRIIPPWVPKPVLMNQISGIAEIALAILLLIPATRSMAAWGIIALLIAVFPANVYHLQKGGAGMKIPIWLLWLRLPLQGLLIWWAWLFT